MNQNWMTLRYVQLGLSFGITFTLFAVLGYWGGRHLDQRLGSEPWFMIIGMFVGTIFALYSLVKDILAVDSMSTQKKYQNKSSNKKP